MKGMFITFEGPDGSGKTTQLKMLAEYLIEKGYDVITTREPGGTKIGDNIREILLDPQNMELKNQTEILLYAASRAQLVHELILPSMEQGKIVLCDRFIDASIAYQAYGLQMDLSIVKLINQFASSSLTPNRTYLLNITPEEGKRRLQSRYSDSNDGKGLDRIEQKELEYHQRVLEGFHKLAIENKDRILVMDANMSISDIAELIQEDIRRLL